MFLTIIIKVSQIFGQNFIIVLDQELRVMWAPAPVALMSRRISTREKHKIKVLDTALVAAEGTGRRKQFSCKHIPYTIYIKSLVPPSFWFSLPVASWTEEGLARTAEIWTLCSSENKPRQLGAGREDLPGRRRLDKLSPPGVYQNSHRHRVRILLLFFWKKYQSTRSLF